MPTAADLQSAIRDVPDFPKEGVLFKDITPILGDPTLLKTSIELLAASAGEHKIDKVVGIDARGFIFGTGVALALGAGFVPIRKKGKLPWKTEEISYTLEYGQDTVEIHADAILPGEKVLLVDDLLATGGTAAASIQLLKNLKAEIISASFLIELVALDGRHALGATPTHSILSY